jgi:hypothetical protein
MNQPPKFNVVEPFQGVVIVQMNDEMGQLLSDFINDVEDVEREIRAFSKALQDPLKSRELRDHKKGRNGHKIFHNSYT